MRLRDHKLAEILQFILHMSSKVHKILKLEVRGILGRVMCHAKVYSSDKCEIGNHAWMTVYHDISTLMKKHTNEWQSEWACEKSQCYTNTFMRLPKSKCSCHQHLLRSLLALTLLHDLTDLIATQIKIAN